MLVTEVRVATWSRGNAGRGINLEFTRTRRSSRQLPPLGAVIVYRDGRSAVATWNHAGGGVYLGVLEARGPKSLGRSQCLIPGWSFASAAWSTSYWGAGVVGFCAVRSAGAWWSGPLSWSLAMALASIDRSSIHFAVSQAVP